MPTPLVIFYFHTDIVAAQSDAERVFWRRVIELELAALFASGWWHEAAYGHRAWIVPQSTVDWLREILGTIPIAHAGDEDNEGARPTTFTTVAARMVDALRADTHLRNRVKYATFNFETDYFIHAQTGTAFIDYEAPGARQLQFGANGRLRYTDSTQDPTIMPRLNRLYPRWENQRQLPPGQRRGLNRSGGAVHGNYYNDGDARQIEERRAYGNIEGGRYHDENYERYPRPYHGYYPVNDNRENQPSSQEYGTVRNGARHDRYEREYYNRQQQIDTSYRNEGTNRYNSARRVEEYPRDLYYDNRLQQDGNGTDQDDFYRYRNYGGNHAHGGYQRRRQDKPLHAGELNYHLGERQAQAQTPAVQEGPIDYDALNEQLRLRFPPMPPNRLQEEQRHRDSCRPRDHRPMNDYYRRGPGGDGGAPPLA